MSEKVTTMSFEEFLQDNVKELTNTMDWMKNRTMCCCESIPQMQDFVQKCIDKNICAFDTETTGLNTRIAKDGGPTDRLVGVSMSYDGLNGIYVPINHQEGAEYNLPEKEVLREVQRLCSNCVIIVHNSRFDLQILKNYRIIVEEFNRFEDTLIMSKLHDAGRKDNKLKVLSETLLKQPMIELGEITGGSKKFNMVSPKISYIYAASDAICTYNLYEYFLTQKTFLDQKSIYNLEKRLVPVVMQMEANLIYIDTDYLKQERERIQKRLHELEEKAFSIVGRKFNIASSQQIGKLFFDDKPYGLGYEYPGKTKTASGQYRTDNATLEKIQEKYPLVKLITEHRELGKALGTYIENLLNNCDEDGCIKLGFNQNGTDTGRFSSPGGEGINVDGYSGVNVQSLPANYEEGVPDIRRAFRAKPGKTLVAMDFSGEELRVAANLSGETKWIDEFLYGSADLHTATGKAIFKKEEISKAERQVAKCVAKGTLIASKNGWVPIEKIKIGDLVYTHNLELKPVEKVWEMGNKPGITITATNSYAIPHFTAMSITCGLNHRFLDSKVHSDTKRPYPKENDWIRAEDLIIGQTVYTIPYDSFDLDNTPMVYNQETILEKSYHENVELMDLTVKDDHTYIAQGFITHNTCNFQILYGAGPRGVSEQAKISENEARRAVTGFFEGLPKLAKWIRSERDRARRNKGATTPFGRIRPLHMFYDSGDRGLEAHADRCSVNFLVQGCLQKTERVLTSLGYMDMDHILSEKNKNNPIKVWTGTSWEEFDVLDRSEWQYGIIQLTNGLKLKCDTRHEVLTVGNNGYEFKKFKELNQDSMVCVSVPQILEYGQWPQYPKEYYHPTIHNRKSMKIEDRQDWVDIAYIMGYIVGDGGTVKREDISHYTVSFCFGKKKLNKHYESLKQKLAKYGLKLNDPRKSSGSLGESYTASCNSVSFIELLQDFGFDFSQKRVPERVFSCPLEMRKAFLRGFFDTDGAKNPVNRYNFHSPNRELLEDVQLLGWSLGCSSRICTDNTGAHLLNWESMQAITNILELPCPTQYKYRGRDMILPKFMHHEVLSRVEKCGPHTSAEKALLSKLRTGKNVSTQSMVQLLQSKKAELPVMYFYYKVKATTIEDHKGPTYTLAVHSPLHRFDSVGIISKNTCADIMKTVMVRVSNWIKSNNLQDEIKILITMHDELVFEMPSDKLMDYIPPLNNIMGLKDILQDILKWPVPLTVDAEYGDSWHVDHNFFKEHPDLKSYDKSIIFKGLTQVTEAPISDAVPESAAEQTPVIQSDSIPTITDPVPTSESVTGSTTEPTPEIIIGVVEPAPEITMSVVDTPAEPPQSIIDDGYLYYTIKQTNQSTARRINFILSILTDYERDQGGYQGPIKILRLCDREGNILSVSDIKVRTDSFITLARTLGI